MAVVYTKTGKSNMKITRETKLGDILADCSICAILYLN